MKRSLCFILSLVMVLCTVSGTLLVSVSASAVGTAGLTYELNEDGESYKVTGYSQTLPDELVIPDTYNGKPVTVVGKRSFMYAEDINSIVVGKNVKVIEPFSFFRTTAEYISLPEGLKEIEDSAITGAFISVDIPDTVEYIGSNGVLAQNYIEDNGYYYIDNWLIEAAVDGGPQRVDILPGTVGIANDVIEYIDDFTGAKYVNVPASVKYIGQMSFMGYSGVYIADDNPYFEEKDGVVYTEDYKRLIFASPDFVYGNLVIPEGVEAIDIFSFMDCHNLLSVEVPSSVTEFNNGLEHLVKVMVEEEAAEFTRPGQCFAFIQSLDMQDSFKIITGCSSAAANQSYVMSLAGEDGFEYNQKVVRHNEVIIPGREATCKADGLTEGIKCADCKVVIKKQEAISGGHNYGELTVYKAPTTTATGVGRYTCETCGEYKTVTLAQLVACPKTQGSNDVGGVKVTWNKVAGAAEYALFRREGGSSIWVQLTTTTAIEYFDKAVENNKYYVYSAKAYNTDGVASAYNSANTKTVKVTSTPKLTSIQNVTNGVQIKWNAVSGVTNYRVYRRGAGSTYWTYLGDTKNTSYVDSKASSGAYWRYTVRAVNNGYYSGFDTTGLYIKRLANPYSIKTANALNGVTVSWAKINGALSYRVYRKAAGQSSWTYLGNASTNSYTDKNVVSGTYYKYTVKAASGATTSSYYDGSLIRFLKAPVISGYSATTKNVTVKWNKVTGATAYRVYRRGAGEGWKLVATVSGTSYTDSKVVKNSYYRYTIRSVNGGYISGYDNNGYVLKFVPSSSAASSTTTSKPSTKNDIVAYYNKAVNNAKKSAKGIVLNEYMTENYNNICEAGTLSSQLDSLIDSFLNEHSFPNETYPASQLPPSELNCNINVSKVKTATITESGNNYVITIVMNPQNSAYRNDGGIGSAVNIITENEISEAVSGGVSFSNINIKYDNASMIAVVNKSTGKLVKLTTDVDFIVSGTASSIDMRVGVTEKNVFSVNY